ncbi:translation elongation factor Ts [Mycoplasma crocodyli]|uniref:Elongation factor Ts n=1 Tax=Mycoplasma crocodyli (strain ATCC 51981 / MP145) TaxID=512564 RepID=D5E5E8_MYCCM|nr:translation elongation factor Ts [Mycoplasma crocodyli]ADE19363.1 translation elongation factor Ts [Mycoplasma crocodyli MP145]
MVNMETLKKLREKTNAGMMDCRKALDSTNWDLAAAEEWLRENGISKAAKKADRIAAEGLVTIASNGKSSVLVELNSETDFVAKNEKFVKLLNEIAAAILKANPKSNDDALKVKLASGQTIEEACVAATSTIGEKVSFRRFFEVHAGKDEVLGNYVHANGLIAAIVRIKGTSEEIARNVAMHLAAMNPEFIFEKDMSAERVKHIKEAFETPKDFDKKPEKIQKLIVDGWYAKQLSEIVLLDQSFIIEDSKSVGKYLEDHKSTLIEAKRFEVGEGIEKVQSNFAEEVMSFVNK